jgi:hypothetical protein
MHDGLALGGGQVSKEVIQRGFQYGHVGGSGRRI